MDMSICYQIPSYSACKSLGVEAPPYCRREDGRHFTKRVYQAQSRQRAQAKIFQGDFREQPCEDFLKDKVPCLIGDANSGKKSLFHPILGIVHHTNIATITKQRAFNHAIILKSTEVTFIDEASMSTMDIDDWKILTQGGYTACDRKYQTAKCFINHCPILLTAQTKLQFKPEDQPAMGRRLRSYSFKSVLAPKKSASAWLQWSTLCELQRKLGHA